MGMMPLEPFDHRADMRRMQLTLGIGRSVKMSLPVMTLQVEQVYWYLSNPKHVYSGV